MNLVSVYVTDSARILYDLLREREPVVNISHIEMPTWQQHLAYIASEPYPAWYLIEVDKFVGAVYLTDRNEIGVFVLKTHQGKGHGPKAVKLLMELHPRDRFIANINPGNERSIKAFTKLGFTHIQNTYAL